MALWWKLHELVGGLFRRHHEEQALDEEMDFYLEQLTERYVQRGYSPEAARQAARREFGPVEHWQESARRERGGRRLVGFLQDLRHTTRSLLRDPGFSVVVILTLALGIGLNTAVFGVLKGIYLDPLPLPDSDRLVFVQETTAQQGAGPAAYANYLDWRERNRTCAAMGAYHDSHLNITDGPEPVRIRVARMTASLTDVLGIAPRLGRSILPADEEGAPCVQLSHALWRNRYGADPAVLGTSIELDGVPHLIIGVMPADFLLPSPRNPAEPFDLFLPMPAITRFDPRGVHSYWVVARLQDGIARSAARDDLVAIADRLSAEHPDTNEGRSVSLLPVHDLLYGESGRQILLVLGAAALVLLIACANIAALQMARNLKRNREYAIRSTLGADQGRILGQLLGESVVLALLGGAAAYGIAAWSTGVLRHLIPPGMPRSGDIRLDTPVLLFALALALVSALLFSLVPALAVTRSDPALVIKEFHRAGPARSRASWYRTLLVTGQFALSLLLADSTIVLLRSYSALHRTDPGFQRRPVLTLAVSLRGTRYRSAAERTGFFAALLPRLKGLNGVGSVGAVDSLPLEEESPPFTVYPEPSFPGGERPEGSPAILTLSAGDYFQALGVPVERGRPFTLDDLLRSTPASVSGVMVNRALADRLWPDADPVGRRLALDPEGPRWMEVVGVVGDIRQRGYGRTPEPELFVPYSMLIPQRMFLVLQSARLRADLLAAVRQEIAAIDPALPVSEVRTLDEVVAAQFTSRTFYTALIGLFAALALVMAALGIYGVVAYSTARRSREFGIRLALGSQRSELLIGVLRQVVRIAAFGLALGWVGILVTSRVLSSFVYAIRPLDAPTIIGASLLLVLVGLAAALRPALRASRVSPLTAIREGV